MSILDLLGHTLATTTLLGTTVGVVCQCISLIRTRTDFPSEPPVRPMVDFDDSRLIIVAVESRFPDHALVFSASNCTPHDKHAA